MPSPVNPHPAGGNYFSGGHNAAAYGSRGGGAIDGIQVETPWSVRSSLPVRTPFLARMGGWVESFFPTYRALDLRQGARLTIAATDRVASESGGRAQLVLRRTGSTALPRIVLLHCDGTATAGADYVHPGAFATFGVGEAEVRLEIRALDDALVEGDETARVWLVGSNDIGVPGCAEVVLFDDEPTNDVALHLPLDLAATTTPDASGNGRHGTLLPLGAGPLAVPGRVGGALQFDGVDDRVRLADFAYAPAGEFSVAFWFRTNSTAGTGFRYLLSHGGVATPHRLGVYFDQATGHLRTALLYANDLTGLDVLDITRDLRDGQWHHYALVARRDDLVRVYIDGVETAAAMFLGDQFDPVGDLVLGSRSDLGAGTFAAAALDDVQMARRPWSAVEVHRLHAAAPREAMVYPGTGEDLLLATGIDAAPTSGPRRDVKAAAGGSTLVAHYSSPGGAFSGRFAALAVDVFATGSPSVHPGFAGVHLAVPHVVHGPLPLGPLPANWTFPVPSGFAGVSLMLQPIALDPAAANGLFAAGDAHEIRLH